MTIACRCVIVVMMIAMAVPALAQQASLNGADQVAVIAELERLIEIHYVDESGKDALLLGLKKAREAGAFERIRTPEQFVVTTNGLLQQAYPDRHLGILLPARFTQMRRRFHGDGDHSAHGAARSSDSAERDQHSPRSETALSSVGISAVADLNRDGYNQVAYIAFERLDGSRSAQDMVNRMFQMLADSDSLILDLRNCAGGDVEMVELISSFLFTDPTHLLTTILPADQTGARQRHERWTQPVALSSRYASKPLLVLISERTFSAAESLAFGLQVTDRARLVGQSSGGGGNINDFFELPLGFGASISVGRTFDPRSGKGWEAAGLQPDRLIAADQALTAALAMISEESGMLARMDPGQADLYAVVQAYADAWYQADSQRMGELLAAEFEASHAGIEGPDRHLPHRDRDSQIRATAAGKGAEPSLYHNRRIEQIRTEGNQARVQLVLRRTRHDLHLERTDGAWKLVSDQFSSKARHS